MWPLDIYSLMALLEVVGYAMLILLWSVYAFSTVAIVVCGVLLAFRPQRVEAWRPKMWWWYLGSVMYLAVVGAASLYRQWHQFDEAWSYFCLTWLVIGIAHSFWFAVSWLHKLKVYGSQRIRSLGPRL